PPATAAAGKEATKLGKATLTTLKDDVASGRLGGVLLRGPKPGEVLPVVSPLPSAVVLTDRPALSWPAVKGATGYTVALYVGNDPTARPLWRLQTKETRLPFPEKQPALQPVLHRWSVQARLPDDELQQGVFRDHGVLTLTAH